jgi:transposase
VVLAAENLIMARGYRRVDRDQQFLLPPDMREWLPASDPVWLVMRLIEQLDTSAFHAGRRLGGVGRAGYDPDMVLTLLVWAWLQGEHSSRRIERLCGRDVSFRVICAGDAPDHATIARFRQGFAEAVEALFVEVLMLCRRLGLAQVGVVALDGTKIAAPASPEANRTEEGLRRAAAAEQQRQAARRAAREAARRHAETDAAEDARFGEGRGDEMSGEAGPAGRSGGSSREARIAAAIAELEAEREQAEAERVARAAARRQRVADKGGPVAGRPPAGSEVELAEQAVAAARAAAAGRVAVWESRGGRGRHPYPGGVESSWRVRRAVARLGRARAVVARREAAQLSRRGAPVGNITDPQSRLLPVKGGWVQGYNAQAVTTSDGIILAARVSNSPSDSAAFVPMMDAAVAAAARLGGEPIGLLLADAGYLSVDNLTAPGPDRLIAVGKRHVVERRARDGEEGTGEPGSHHPAVQAMRDRLARPDGIEAYRQRGRIAETPFGHGKHNWTFRQFTGIGQRRAQAEWTFHTAVHNLSKIISHGLTPIWETG